MIVYKINQDNEVGQGGVHRHVGGVTQKRECRIVQVDAVSGFEKQETAMCEKYKNVHERTGGEKTKKEMYMLLCQ